MPEHDQDAAGLPRAGRWAPHATTALHGTNSALLKLQTVAGGDCAGCGRHPGCGCGCGCCRCYLCYRHRHRSRLPSATPCSHLLRAFTPSLASTPSLALVALAHVGAGTISSWSPTAIATSIANVASAAASLSSSNASKLIPELITVDQALAPLACVRDVLTQLTMVNASILQLTPDVQTFFQRARALSLSLEAIPSPLAFVGSLNGLAASLAALPSLPEYTAGVSTISIALGAMPPSSTLLTALAALALTLDLPPTHELLSNVSSTLRHAMDTLPPLAPFRSSLESLNASRADLPTLITQAIAAIDQYDTSGTTTNLLESVEATKAAGAERVASRLLFAPSLPPPPHPSCCPSSSPILTTP